MTWDICVGAPVLQESAQTKNTSWSKMFLELSSVTELRREE